MRVYLLFILSLILGGRLVHSQDPVREAPPVVGDEQVKTAKKTSSRNGRFIVYGESPELRRAVLRLGDNAHAEFLRLFQTDQKDDAKANIVVELLEGKATGVPMKSELLVVTSAKDKFRLNLYVNLAKGIDADELKRELIRLSLIERALRTASSDDDRQWQVPEWLMIGLEEAVAWNNDKGDRELYASVLESGTTLTIEELLTLQRDEASDPISRMTFRVWSGALVMAMLDSGDVLNKQKRATASQAFKAFLSKAVGYDGEMEILLRSQFPKLSLSPNSLKKLIALKLANLSRVRLDERMTVAQTERELNRILLPVVNVAGVQQAGPLWVNLPQMEVREKREATKQAISRLIRLSYRSFPLYREVIVGYRQLILDSLTQRQELVGQRATELENLRERMRKDANRARDVLDWYELNTQKSVSGELMDYVKLRQETEKKSSRRTDSLSRYLDEAQRILGTKE